MPPYYYFVTFCYLLLFVVSSLPLSKIAAASGDEASCSAGIRIDERLQVRPGTWANICPDMQITCAGQVSKWEFHSVVADASTFYLSIWRRTGTNSYVLVGYNAINATKVGLQNYLVPPDQQIRAQIGDFVGIFYEKPGITGAIPYAAAAQPSDAAGGGDQQQPPTGTSSYYHCITFESYRFQLQTQMRSAGFVQVLAYPVRRAYAVKVFVGPTEFDCSAGQRVPDAPRITSSSYAQLCFNMMFTCSGVLDRWDYYSSLDDGSIFYLSVWRHLFDDKFALIGLTRMNATRRGRQTHELTPSEQFRVVAGDFCGVFYEVPQIMGAIPSVTPFQGDPQPAEFYDCAASAFYAPVIDTQMKAHGFVQIERRTEKKVLSFQGFVKAVEQTECRNPPEVPHSRVIGTGNTVGASRTYICDTGYVLVGAETILCGSSGDWQPALPECRRIPATSCGPPPEVANSRNNYTGENTVGTKIGYSCLPGFYLIGEPVVDCQVVEGIWTTPPLCKEIHYDCAIGSTPLPNTDSPIQRPTLNAFPSLRFDCDAEITYWEFYSTATEPTPVYFDVWRQMDEDKYELTGSNRYVATSKGQILFEVPSDFRVKVTRGDFIGVHYESNARAAVVPYFDKTVYRAKRDVNDIFMEESIVPATFYDLLEKNVTEAELQSYIAQNYYFSFRTNVLKAARSPSVKAYAVGIPGCGVPPPVRYAKFTFINDIATYKCFAEFEMQGDATIRCRKGKWQTPPTCQLKALCALGRAVVNRPPLGLGSYLTIFINNQFTCEGVLTEWDIYSNSNRGTVVYLDVWEPVRDTPNSYRRVGSNRFSGTERGQVIFRVPVDKQIFVKPGMLFGYHYDSTQLNQDALVIPHASNSAPEPWTLADLFDAYILGYDEDQLQLQSDVIAIQEGVTMKELRIPALRATVRSALADCGVPRSIPNGGVNFARTHQGAIATYYCNDGFTIYGDANVTCRGDETWGQAPSCKEMCNVGRDEVKNYPDSTTVTNLWLNVFEGMQFTCPGKVIAWKFYSRIPDALVYFGVWEKMSARGDQAETWRLVRANQIKVKQPGVQTYPLSPDEQIYVRPGQAIGVHYEKSEGSLSDLVVPTTYSFTAHGDKLFNTNVIDWGNVDVMANDGVVVFDPNQNRRSWLHEKRAPALQALVEQTEMSCFGGWIIADNPGIEPTVWLTLFLDIRFQCSMEIESWEFYSLSDDGTTVFLDVWREVEARKYELIGSNSVQVNKKGRNVFEVDQADRIRVASGDFIGIHYAKREGPGVIVYFNEKVTGNFQGQLSSYLEKDVREVDIRDEIKTSYYVAFVNQQPQVGRVPSLMALGREFSDCGMPPRIPNGYFTVKTTTVGSVATYACHKEYKLDGNIISTCKKDLKWTDAPKCVLKEQCNVGPPVYPQSLPNAGAWLTVFTNMEVTCHGRIAGWTFYSNTAGNPVYFAVWEKLGETEYHMLGANRVIPTRTGLQTIAVNPDEMILVRPGNVIGYHYDDTRLPQSLLVLPHADAAMPGPYKDTQMYDVYVEQMSHHQIQQERNRVRFTSIKFTANRIAALQGSIQESDYNCVAGQVYANNDGTPPGQALNIFPSLQFPCSLEVRSWEFYSLKDDGTVVYFDVWRQVGDDKFELVGSNRIQATSIGQQIYEVPPKLRIRAGVGDFIGVHYESANGDGVVPFFTHLNPGRYLGQLQDFLDKVVGHAGIMQEINKNFYVSFGKDMQLKKKLPALVALGNKLPGCGMPPSLLFGAYSVQNTEIDAVAVYSCYEGFELIGQPTTVCAADNSWSNPPSCQLKKLCQSGRDVADVPLANTATLLNVFSTMKIDCDGVIAGWTFYSMCEQCSIYLAAWEQAAGYTYRMIGFNRVVVNRRGIQTYVVPAEEQIPVKKGDVIGYHYDSWDTFQSKAVIPHADVVKPFPYTFPDDFYDGFSKNLGHSEILDQGKRVDFNGFKQVNWRVPALAVYVKSPLTDCGPVPEIDWARTRRTDTSLTVRVSYECESGFTLEGSSTIICQDGKWTAPPKCKASNDCVWGRVVPDKPLLEPRDNELNLYPNNPIMCQGLVKEWTIYSRHSSEKVVYMDVWRRERQTVYKLVGTNVLTVNKVGLKTFSVPDKDQIFVQVGDIVGFHYDRVTPLVIPFAEEKDGLYDKNDLYDTIVATMYHTDLVAGNVYTFDRSNFLPKNRIPSVRVHVQNTQTQVLGSCNVDTTCPEHAICMERGCDGFGCVCEESFWPNDAATSCLRAAELGEYCDSLIACRGPNLECRNGRCSCITSWTPARDGRRCKPISFTPDSDYALLGDACNATTLCFYANNDQQCQLGSCHCKAGFRPATAVEERAFPSIPFECRQNTFSLVITDRSRQCPPTETKSPQLAAMVAMQEKGEDSVVEEEVPPRMRTVRSVDRLVPLLATIAVVAVVSLVIILIVLFGRPSRLMDLLRAADPAAAAAVVANDGNAAANPVVDDMAAVVGGGGGGGDNVVMQQLDQPRLKRRPHGVGW